MKTYRIMVSYLIPMEEIVEYTVETEDENQLQDINFLEENATEAVVIDFSQASDPYDPKVLTIEALEDN